MRETTITSISRSKSRKKPAQIPSRETHSKAVLKLVEATLEKKGGLDIVAIDLHGKTDIADYMIVASGTSVRHVGSLAEHVAEVLRKVGINPLQMEGEGGSEWVVVDNPLVMVHIFHPQTREIYNLEKMWSAEFK